MNLKIKETLAKIVNWLKGGEWITTTNTLCVQGETGADVGLTAKSIDGTGSVLLGVGSGGDNHGVYSRTMSRWMIYSDGTYTWFDNNAGGHYRWDMSTLNTTDTWVPVLSNARLQHRVIPARLGDIIKVQRVTLGSQTVAANSGKSINLYAPCVNAAPSGYSFVGIVGFSTNNAQCVVESARPTNSAYSFEYKNTGSSSATSTPEVFALYTRD